MPKYEQTWSKKDIRNSVKEMNQMNNEDYPTMRGFTMSFRKIKKELRKIGALGE